MVTIQENTINPKKVDKPNTKRAKEIINELIKHEMTKAAILRNKGGQTIRRLLLTKMKDIQTQTKKLIKEFLKLFNDMINRP